MPRRFTMAALETRARQMTDAENDGHVTQAYIFNQISSLYGELWGTVAETGYRYFERRTVIASGASVGGANVLDEPDDHFATVRLAYLEPTTLRPRVLTEIMPQEQDLMTFGQGTGAWAQYFELVDDQFLLYPLPPAGQSYELRYVGQPPELSTFPSDTLVDVVTPDGETFLVNGLAVAIKQRQEKELIGFLKERDRAKERLVEFATMRSLHQKRRQVVEREDDWWNEVRPGDWRWSPP